MRTKSRYRHGIASRSLSPLPGVIGLLTLLFVCVPAKGLLAQSFAVLHTFTNEADGYEVYTGLARDGMGNLYGATYYGGAADSGALFKLDASGRFSVVHSFIQATDGGQPLADLLLDLTGNVYGTAENGGAGGGTIFKFDRNNGFSVLYSFTGGQDGSIPNGLVRDVAGNIYGTTARGGDFNCPDGVSGCGAVFKLNATHHLMGLHQFTGPPDGQWPGDGLVRDSAGNLYGTTNIGGTHNNGTIFKIDTSGPTTVLYSFTGTSDGSFPTSALVQDPQGNLYGTTNMGGNMACNAPYGCGTIFKLDQHGNLAVLHRFSGGSDGAFPLHGRLLRDARGNLYGTTSGGGASRAGIVFELEQNGQERVLHTFHGNFDGASPYASLIQDNAGTLYGATVYGGNLQCNAPYGCGVVFRLVP